MSPTLLRSHKAGPDMLDAALIIAKLDERWQFARLPGCSGDYALALNSFSVAARSLNREDLDLLYLQTVS